MLPAAEKRGIPGRYFCLQRQWRGHPRLMACNALAVGPIRWPRSLHRAILVAAVHSGRPFRPFSGPQSGPVCVMCMTITGAKLPAEMSG